MNAIIVASRSALPASTTSVRLRGQATARVVLPGGVPERPGARADLVLFDAATVRDTATYDVQICEPEGIALVVVSGVVAYGVEHHTHTGSGQTLRFNE